MTSNQPSYYTCQACGHTFSAPVEQITRQPTCPKCRTFGKLTGPGLGRPKGPTRRPGPARPCPMPQQDGEPVVVSADVVYGRKGTGKSIATTAILVVLGIGIVITLFFIVTSVQRDRSARTKQEKEVAMDTVEFERAINEGIAKVRATLELLEGAEIIETEDFSTVMQAIAQSGGGTPAWSSALRPGSPFKAHGFVVRAKHARTGQMVSGCVMLLYYLTADEVAAAHSELRRDLDNVRGNFSLRVNEPMWFVAYSGVSHGGEVSDALRRAMMLGQPSSFQQFTRRVGASGQK